MASKLVNMAKPTRIIEGYIRALSVGSSALIVVDENNVLTTSPVQRIISCYKSHSGDKISYTFETENTTYLVDERQGAY